MGSPNFAGLVDRTASEDGLQYVFPFFAGWRQLVTARKDVQDLRDVDGLKLRATDSAVELAYDSALGARPTTLPFGETYLGLTQGLVDGLMIGYTDLTDFKMIDAVRHGFTLDIAPELVMAFMDARFFESLPPDLRQNLLDAGSATDLFAQQVAADAEKNARDAFRKAGVNINDPSEAMRETFIVRTRSVYPQFTDVLNKSDMDTIEKLRQ
jgi:TRAP-type C4-dicarboxylate transport system substrate-binding protein